MVGFNAVLTSEHFGAFFTFAVLHAALAIRYIKVGAAAAAAAAAAETNLHLEIALSIGELRSTQHVPHQFRQKWRPRAYHRVFAAWSTTDADLGKLRRLRRRTC